MFIVCKICQCKMSHNAISHAWYFGPTLLSTLLILRYMNTGIKRASYRLAMTNRVNPSQEGMMSQPMTEGQREWSYLHGNRAEDRETPSFEESDKRSAYDFEDD